MSTAIPRRGQPLIVTPGEQTKPAEDKAATEARTAREARIAEDVKRQSEKTPEQLEEERQEFVDLAVRGIRRKAEEKDKKEEEPKKEESKEAEVVKEGEKVADDKADTTKSEDAEADKADEKKDTEPPKPVKAKRKVAEPTPAPSVDSALKDAITHGVTEAVRPLVDQLKKDEPKLDINLSDKDKKRLEVIQHLESTNAAHKGLAAKTLEFWKKETDYQKQWESKNPGETFDPGADEHNAFYQKHEPQVSDDELEQAKESLIESRVSKKLEAKQKEQMSEYERQREFESTMPKIDQDANMAMLDFIPAAVPAFKELMTDDKGNVRLTVEIVEKMKETDPEAFNLLDAEGEKMRHVLKELDLITKFPDRYKVDPRKSIRTQTTGERFFPHATIEAFVSDLETELSGLPNEETSKDGKSFITHAEYNAKTEALKGQPKAAVEAGLREIERQHWYLTPEIIKRSYMKDSADRVAEQLKFIEGRVQRRVKATNGETAEQREERERLAAEKEEQRQEEETRKAAKPPSGVVSSDKVDTSKKGGSPGGISEDIWDQKVRGY